MKTIINFIAVGVYTEHAYVQNPIMEIRDVDLSCIPSVAMLIAMTAKDYGFYKNHIVFKLDNGMYLGWDDNQLSISNEIGVLSDSKFVKFKETYSLTFKLH